MLGYVDLHIRIFVCLPKPGTRTQQSLRHEFPSGKMHLRILTSIFYMIPISTSLLPLTVTSLRLSADTTQWRTGYLQGSFFHSYGFSPTRAEPQASKHYSKPPELPHRARHTEQVSAATSVPLAESCVTVRLVGSVASAPAPLQGEWTRIRNKPCWSCRRKSLQFAMRKAAHPVRRRSDGRSGFVWCQVPVLLLNSRT